MVIIQILFWLFAGLLFYSYIGYVLLVGLLSALRDRKKPAFPGALPAITLVIPAYNEAGILQEKLANSSQLEYPPHLLQFIVVADGSDDDTARILAGHPKFKLLLDPVRAGKAAALNHAMQQVNTPLVVFSDANTMLNKGSLLLMVSHFFDPEVGGVAGEKKLLRQTGMGTAEGWYWRYESLMKKTDAAWYSVVGAAGELFALRTGLYRSLPADTILDDLALSIDICLQGYIITYEPGAYASEPPSVSLHAERLRKSRIASGAFQLLSRLPLSKLVAYPKFAFSFFSRRWLRWVACPPAIIGLLICNIILAASQPIFQWLLCFHLAFYIAAAIGWTGLRRNRSFALTTVPFYFLFMNACMISGWWQWRQKKATVLWPKARR